MDISVIVPIYGVENYIERSLRSLFSQTKTKDVEFILVDDCSKDRSVEIAEKVILEYPTLDIKVIRHEQNMGVTIARQTGLNIATGEYVFHYDSDDYCDSELLESMYNCIIAENADIVIYDYYNDYQNRIERENLNVDVCKQNALELMFAEKINNSFWNKLFKRTLYLDNEITIVPGVNMGDDFIVVSKLLVSANKIVYIKKAHYYYVHRQGSLTNKYSQKSCKDLLLGIAEVEKYLQDKGLKDRYYDSLQYKKILLKLLILRYTQGQQQREFVNLFPESSGYIWKHPYIGLHYKLALYCADHNMLCITNVICNIVALIKKLI